MLYHLEPDMVPASWNYQMKFVTMMKRTGKAIHFLHMKDIRLGLLSLSGSICSFYWEELHVQITCFIVNFENISHLVLVFLLLTLSR